MNGTPVNDGAVLPLQSARPSPVISTKTKKPRNRRKTGKSDGTLHYRASIYPTVQVPDSGLIAVVQALENSLGMPVWMLVQNGATSQFDDLNRELAQGFLRCKSLLPEGTPVALVIDSPGGYAKCAYQIASLLRRRCGRFVAVVPQYAKSAATLLALGADRIILGEDAELGPLDAQYMDPASEEIRSALDEVQSLERLFAASLDAIDQAMQLVVNRTGKKVENVLAPVMHFVSEMMAPLFQKIDTVQYSQKSRVLKVAEEYATRLLMPQYPPNTAKRMARHLVERYPEHGFVIDGAEAATFGLRTERPTLEQTKFVDELNRLLEETTVLGRLEEVRVK
jgi:Serine dehydrogenase proteinase